MTGAVVGVAQYGYFGSRGLLAVLALLILREIVVDWRWPRRNAVNMLILAGAFLVAWLPQGIFFVDQAEQFFGRVRGVSVFNGSWLAQEAVNTGRSEAGVILEQLIRSFKVFISEPPRTFYTPGRPILEPVSSLFFIVGAAALLWSIRRRAHFAVIGSFVLLVTLQALTIDVPNSSRLVIVAPLACLIAGAGLYAFVRLMTSGPNLATHAIVGAVLVYSAASGVYFYFVDYPKLHDQGAVAPTELAYFLREQPENTRVILFAQPAFSCTIHASLRFIAGHRVCVDMPLPGTPGERPVLMPTDIVAAISERRDEALQFLSPPDRYEPRSITSPAPGRAGLTVYTPRNTER
jgi:hypothetical protein